MRLVWVHLTVVAVAAGRPSPAMASLRPRLGTVARACPFPSARADQTGDPSCREGCTRKAHFHEDPRVGLHRADVEIARAPGRIQKLVHARLARERYINFKCPIGSFMGLCPASKREVEGNIIVDNGQVVEQVCQPFGRRRMHNAANISARKMSVCEWACVCVRV